MAPGRLSTGREIAVLLALRGAKAQDVARAAGLSPSAMSRILRDRVDHPDPKVISRIREVLIAGDER